MKRPVHSALAALAVILSVMTSTGPSPATASARVTPDARVRYFVLLEKSPQELRTRTAVVADQLRTVNQAVRLGGEIHYRYSTLLNAFSADLSSDAAATLRSDPGVERVVPVSIVRRTNTDSVPFIGGTAVRNRFGLTGKAVTVAVVDSGVDYTHATFNGRGTTRAYDRNDPDVVESGTFPTTAVIGGYDFVGDDYNPTDKNPGNDVPQPDGDPLDLQGHGTHVAGTCCGRGAPGSVGRGVAPRSKILAYKVWGPSGSSTSDVLVAAFERVVDPDGDGDTSDRADVLSFSGGVNYGTEESIESIAAHQVIEAGTVFVAAAGNAGSEVSGGAAYRVGAPAAAPDVIAVAASTVPQDTIAGFSSQGPVRYTSALKPDIAAPGSQIMSAAVGSGDGGASLSGTSMATPHVSGAAALLLQRFPEASPAQIKALLMNRTVRRLDGPSGTTSRASLEGAGRVDLEAAASATFFVDPPSLSFGLSEITGEFETEAIPVTITNLGTTSTRFKITSRAAIPGSDDSFAHVLYSDDGVGYGGEALFVDVDAEGTGEFWVKVRLDGDLVEGIDQFGRWDGRLFEEWGWVVVRSTERGESARAVWHTVADFVSQIAAPDVVTVDPATGEGALTLNVTPSAGEPYADLYPAGVADDSGDNSFAEADIVAVGARSFTGTTIGDGAADLPTYQDPRIGYAWRTFVRGADNLREPIEFVVITDRSNETIESPTATFYIDVGADGIFADEGLQADFKVTKALGDARVWCLIDLSEDPTDCVTTYGGDYPTYLTRLLGVVVDATDLGLTESTPRISVRAEVCSDTFSGDVLQPSCDDSAPVTIDVVAPDITFETLMCDGFWSTIACTDPNQVAGSPGAAGLIVMPHQPNSFEFFVLE